MKRPQGFDRAPAPGRAGENGARSATGSRPARERKTGQEPRSETITEPVPIIREPGSAPRPDAAATSRDADLPRTPSAARASRDRRRYERSEVKRFTRRSRRRKAIWIASITTVVVVLGVTVLAAFSPLMAVRTIDVVGTTRVDAAAVRASLNSQLGKPLPLVDYAAVRDALDRYRLIRSYSTEAVPPGTLVVRIVERTPIGLLRTATGYDLVDQAGVVISSTAQKPGGYPVITVAGSEGSAAAKASFAASAAVLGVLPTTLIPQIGSITASSAEDVTFTLGGRSVTWGGPEDPTLKATVLAALLKAAPHAGGYDVSSPNAPVTR